MAFEIFIPNRSHLQELVRIKQKAFRSFELFQIMMPIDEIGTMEHYFAAREELWYDCADQRAIAVRETDTGRAVAWSRWSIPSPNNPDTRLLVPPPEGTKLDLYQTLRQLQKDLKRPYKDHASEWELLTVATDPAFEGRGCGKLMLQYITNLADEVGASIDLWASATGMHLYRKFDFQEKDQLVMDLSKYGRSENAKVLTWMVRAPRLLANGEGAA